MRVCGFLASLSKSNAKKAVGSLVWLLQRCCPVWCVSCIWAVGGEPCFCHCCQWARHLQSLCQACSAVQEFSLIFKGKLIFKAAWIMCCAFWNRSRLWSSGQRKYMLVLSGNKSCLVLLIPTIALPWSHLLIGRLRDACLWSTVSWKGECWQECLGWDLVPLASRGSWSQIGCLIEVVSRDLHHPSAAKQ